MKRKYIFILTLSALLIVVFRLIANETGIAGRTGSPSEVNCTNCHNTYTLNSGTGSIVITHNIPLGGYSPSTAYTINIIVNYSAMPVFGFDFEALNTSNTSAGTIAVTSTTTTQLMTAGNGRSNITHKLNGGLTTGTHTFSFTWTSPSSNIGNITFYAAGVCGNHNGSEFGDYVYTTSLVITPFVVSNAVATGTISGSPFCSGQTGLSVPYTITGTFNTGNNFTAQLSDSSGSFTTPAALGAISSTTAGSITTTAVLPSIPGTKYRIRVISSNPATTGTDNGTNLTISTPVTANAGIDQSLCSTSATFAGNTPSSGSGIWSVLSGSGTITSQSSPVSTVTSLGAGANSFIWTITNGGCTTKDTVIINSVPNPSTSIAGPDQNLCSNTVSLAGNTPTVGIGTWTQISGTGTITNTNNPSTTVTSLSAGNNIFVWTISNAPCSSSRDTVIISVGVTPTLANAGSDQLLCAITATLAGNTASVGTGTWSLVSGTATITNPTSATSGLTSIGVGNNILVWKITNGICSSFDTVIIARNAPPTTAIAGNAQTVCATTVTLAGDSPIVGIGTWTQIIGTGTIVDPSNPKTSVTGISSGLNKFVWTIANPPCAASRDTVAITQSGSITTANAGPDQTLCSTSTTLAANTPIVGTGQWSLISGTATITNPSSPTSGVTGMGNGNIVLRWTISNSGCTPSTSDVTIHNCLVSNTIATGSVSGSPFCASTSYSVVIPFTTTGTFIGYYIAELSDSSGSFTVPTSIGAGSQSPVYGYIPSNSIPGNHYRIRIKNTSPVVVGADNGTNLSINNCIANSITTGSIVGSPFCNSTSYSLSVPFNFTGTFTGYFIAELSDSSGSFALPTTIGTGSVSPISAVIPSSSIQGSKYRIRVRNTLPATLSSDNGSNLSVNTCITNTIFTGTINGSPFCNTTSYSVVIPFTAAGTFSGYFTAELSDSSGSFNIPVVLGTGASSPIFGVIPVSTLSGTKYRIRVRNSNPYLVGSNNGVNLSINTCITNTITTGTISGSPFCVNTSYSLSVPFSSTGVFNGYFTVQLSDANGSFSNPVPIGVGGSSPINAMIPSNTANGTMYKIRVVNNNPVINGTDNGTFLEINDCNVLIPDSIKGSPFCGSTSYSVSVPFKIIGGSTGPFVAELSSATGDFTLPLTIGYGFYSPISATIPSKTNQGYNYRIRVRDESSGYMAPPCGNNLLINTCGNVGLTDIDQSPIISVFPNPNSGKFTLILKDIEGGDFTIAVFNSIGEEIWKATREKGSSDERIEMNIAEIANGMYLIHVQSRHSIAIRKIAIAN